jgi:hypothetical protein
VADHFYTSNEEPVLDETLDDALEWLRDYAHEHGLDLESRYQAWNLLWTDRLGNDRSIQVNAVEGSPNRLAICPLSWFDTEEVEGVEHERRHAHIPRHYFLVPPFSREMFDKTLDLAFNDAAATDPLHNPTYSRYAARAPGIKVYRKPRPVN